MIMDRNLNSVRILDHVGESGPLIICISEVYQFSTLRTMISLRFPSYDAVSRNHASKSGVNQISSSLSNQCPSGIVDVTAQ